MEDRRDYKQVVEEQFQSLNRYALSNLLKFHRYLRLIDAIFENCNDHLWSLGCRQLSLDFFYHGAFYCMTCDFSLLHICYSPSVMVTMHTLGVSPLLVATVGSVSYESLFVQPIMRTGSFIQFDFYMPINIFQCTLPRSLPLVALCRIHTPGSRMGQEIGQGAFII